MVFKFIFEYEIEIDENSIYKKYPNFKLNYNSIEEFVDSLITENGFDYEAHNSVESLNKWGFSIKKKRVSEVESRQNL